MAHLGMLRDFEFAGNVDDIRGANIFGPNDEKLGEIDDVIFDHATTEIRYLVIDTGGWLSSHKFVVPANRVTPYHKDKNDFYTDLTKERIELFPAFNDKTLEKRDQWDEYERTYEKAWSEEPILHQKDSDRIITPPSSEIPTDPNAKPIMHERGDFTPERIRDKFDLPKAPFTMNKPMDSAETNEPLPISDPVTGRLTAFQENLRSTHEWSERCEECKKAA